MGINGEANMEDWVPSETDKNAGTGKYGSCCTEIDIWEANKMSMAYTMHACSPGEQTRCDGKDCGDNGEDRFSGMCDKNGCDIQPHRLGTHDFFGPGSNFQIDSTQPVTVTTQFITNDGTDSGKLTEVKQFYTQNGKNQLRFRPTIKGAKYGKKSGGASRKGKSLNMVDEWASHGWQEDGASADWQNFDWSDGHQEESVYGWQPEEEVSNTLFGLESASIPDNSSTHMREL